MSLFDNIAMPLAQTEQEDPTPKLKKPEGFTHEFKFRPAQVVYTMTDQGIVSATVLSVKSEHRSVTGKTSNIESRVTYMLNNSMERTEDQLFDEDTARQIMALIGK